MSITAGVGFANIVDTQITGTIFENNTAEVGGAVAIVKGSTTGFFMLCLLSQAARLQPPTPSLLFNYNGNLGRFYLTTHIHT